jgi:eukaryotic-like serine/threonine-protein kinase
VLQELMKDPKDHGQPARHQAPTAIDGKSRRGPAVTEADGDFYAGKTLAGRYRIERRLGAGGMGVVYLAEHVGLEKRVAVKIMIGDFHDRSEVIGRFVQEAKAASKIGHENIVDITDSGETDEGAPFFVMEYLEGRDLGELLKASGKLPLRRVERIINQVCRGLAATHDKGIVHRDLKPENIFVCERTSRPDLVKLLDFGLAKVSSIDGAKGKLTHSGMVMGTAAYMSPEQASAGPIDHRTDIYSAGCLLYEMLSGQVPFEADSYMSMLKRHVFDSPAPLRTRAPDVPAAVEAVVMRALAKAPADRFQSMKELALAFAKAVGQDPAQAWDGQEAYATRSGAPLPSSVGEEPARNRRGGVVVAGLGVILVGVALLFAWPKKPSTPTPSAPIVTPAAPSPPVVRPSHVTISSTPAGAEVFRGAERLGTTPVVLDLLPSEGRVEVRIEKEGHEPSALTVDGDRDREYVVRLVVQPRPVKKASSPSRRPGKHDRMLKNELKDVLAD